MIDGLIIPKVEITHTFMMVRIWNNSRENQKDLVVFSLIHVKHPSYNNYLRTRPSIVYILIGQVFFENETFSSNHGYHTKSPPLLSPRPPFFSKFWL